MLLKLLMYEGNIIKILEIFFHRLSNFIIFIVIKIFFVLSIIETLTHLTHWSMRNIIRDKLRPLHDRQRSADIRLIVGCR